ncbi:synaptotagmin-6-like [Diaphorina citri]|uniref:Synaptotagmin-6-like n=1 Tax=Diaphorina citri TaxID=121845 RepID=A0A3Q0IVF2_DIACI|nr:synaptotagmin-6-like [Diaphorina citri]
MPMMNHDGPDVQSLEKVSGHTVLGLGLAGLVFVATVCLATCYCRRRSSPLEAKKLALSQMTLKRPTAVRSPAAAGPNSHYLKKSPSPTYATPVANQRVEEYKRQIKQLAVKLKEAEARAEFAEKTVKKLQKEVDRLEVSGHTVLGLGLAGLVFAATVCLATCYCRRRTSPLEAKKLALSQMTLKRPTAVRSPAAAGPNSHYLKKSPSPTYATPVASLVNSPTGSTNSNNGAGSNSHSPIQPCVALPGTVVITENEKAAPLVLGVAGPTTAGNGPAANGTDSDDSCALVNKETVDCDGNAEGKLGQIFFKIKYQEKENVLVVTVIKCRDLFIKDTPSGSSDPYVKVHLLPDKQKVKTRVLRKTRNPIYNEEFTFTGITPHQLKGSTLHFVVFSFDRYSRDDIVGEVFYSLQSFETYGHSLSFCRDIQPRNLRIKSQGRGEILLSLCWQPAANRFTIVVLKARNLPKMDVTGLADPYVKVYLLYKGQRVAKKKTHVKKRTLNPVYNESFVFEVPADNLDSVSLELLLLDWDRVTKNEVIGRLDLGGDKSSGTALTHWTDVCNSPRRQIAEWLTYR